jgi:protocatechuate 3,4-dioxygenase beta subunit
MENMIMKDLALGKIQTYNEGKYILDTIYPKQNYEVNIIRPSHIHVKGGILDQPIYTTQLYFEGDLYLTDHENKNLY